MITAQVESFETALPELRAIFPLHWEELGLFRDKMPLAPQFDEYVRRERAGSLFLTTVRETGKIVAYFTVQIAPGFHYGETLTGTTDMIYIVPEQRGRGLAVPLFRKTEAELKRRGVKVWYAGHKSHNPMGMPGVLDAMGFVPADSYYAKWIGP